VDSVVLANRRAELHIEPSEAARIADAGFDVVVFQGVAGQHAEELARALRASGCRTVYAIGELDSTDMPELVDHVVVASESLRHLIGAKTTVIEGMIETPSGLCKDYSSPCSDARVRVVWVGYPENLHLLAPVRTALADPRLDDFELVTISKGPEATFQWDINHVWEQLVGCDIAVLPADETDWYRTKPNTRMTMLKALGLPIVASPIPSHEATLTHGRGCYFARDVGDWADCLARLPDFERRREMGLAERDEILGRYGCDAIGRRWLELFERLARGD
jgi:glycosyltransferase involved in cell wall biosynthesis